MAFGTAYVGSVSWRKPLYHRGDARPRLSPRQETLAGAAVMRARP